MATVPVLCQLALGLPHSSCSIVGCCSLLCPLILSEVFLEVPSILPSLTTRSPTRSVYDYRRGDFEGLRSALQSVNLSNVVQDNNTINQDWTLWKDTFLAAVADFIPLKTLRKRNGPPWLTGDILHLLRKKESVRKKLKLLPRNEN